MQHDSSYGSPAELTTERDGADEADPGASRRLDLVGLLVCAAVAIGLGFGLNHVLARPSGTSIGRSGPVRAVVASPIGFARVAGQGAPTLCAAPTVLQAAWPSAVPAVDHAPAGRCADMIPMEMIMRPTPVRWL